MKIINPPKQKAVEYIFLNIDGIKKYKLFQYYDVYEDKPVEIDYSDLKNCVQMKP